LKTSLWFSSRVDFDAEAVKALLVTASVCVSWRDKVPS